MRMRFGSDSERQLVIDAVHPTSDDAGALSPQSLEGASEIPGAGALSPQPVSDELESILKRLR